MKTIIPFIIAVVTISILFLFIFMQHETTKDTNLGQICMTFEQYDDLMRSCLKSRIISEEH